MAREIDPIKLPNNCFSIIDKDTKNKRFYRKQRVERGFDSTELWNLDSSILRFTLPRLKAFISEEVELYRGYPNILKMDYPDCTNLSDKWLEILNEMVKGIESYLNDSPMDTPEGLKLFFKYFTHLWS